MCACVLRAKMYGYRYNFNHNFRKRPDSPDTGTWEMDEGALGWKLSLYRIFCSRMLSCVYRENNSGGGVIRYLDNADFISPFLHGNYYFFFFVSY